MLAVLKVLFRYLMGLLFIRFAGLNASEWGWGGQEHICGTFWIYGKKLKYWLAHCDKNTSFKIEIELPILAYFSRLL